MNSMRRILVILSLLLPVTVLVSSASLAETKLDASILSYDGQDFVRTETTLMNEGKSAVGTKLDRDSAAYKALVQKRSYTGPATNKKRAQEIHDKMMRAQHSHDELMSGFKSLKKKEQNDINSIIRNVR